MSNFVKFINEDIEAKKTLFSTMPTKTKRDIKKFNEKIDSVTEKYEEYKVRVKKYLDTKSKSYNIKKVDKNIGELREKLNKLEHVKFILNPLNTYFEKIGFDNLLYEISNYYDFNFNTLNQIINQFLDKFELIGIKINSDDFDYTCYINEYMSAFLEVRNKKSDNYSEVSEIFERIYWVNPEIIEHIELNFRKLIKKYEKKFINYISKHQKEIMVENSIDSYEECLKKLKEVYIKLDIVDKEDVYDIIDLAKNKVIEIDKYFENNKFRTSAYSTLTIDSLNIEDSEKTDKFYENLEKLKSNIEEYNNYIKFLPLFNDFKNEYQSLIPSEEKSSNKNNVSSSLKTIESQISDKESKLEKINKKISKSESAFFESKKDNAVKQMKIDSINLAKELYYLYKKYDQECFKEKVLSVLNNSLTISELLHLYYSFDYFKKVAIKKVFKVSTYDEIVKYSESFDLFAMNPTNIIINGVSLFEEKDVARIIMNKYRLDNINLTEETLNPDDLNLLLEKIQFLLRINEIEKSSTTVEKIWFMVKVKEINDVYKRKN